LLLSLSLIGRNFLPLLDFVPSLLYTRSYYRISRMEYGYFCLGFLFLSVSLSLSLCVCVCVSIYIYIYIYLSLSPPTSPVLRYRAVRTGVIDPTRCSSFIFHLSCSCPCFDCRYGSPSAASGSFCSGIPLPLPFPFPFACFLPQSQIFSEIAPPPPGLSPAAAAASTAAP
jgi:hypothetical protein